ncbi:hypothetical protein WICMUC_004321 [Wickerhamomyces mucosus]|uniref:M7GpppX diphosphatase n=1 Tax=Wickerhamomyces mucosus TaxID=1378264 RepID=A0A9P8TB66_9ASCO|nr:hypothetical protein WICMUC_004321 [Wickerhamomyces mucosus]
MALQEIVKKFQFDRVLTSNPQTKTVALLGFIDGKQAIISFEKSHFLISKNDSLQTAQSFLTSILDVKPITENDVYHWGLITLFQDIEKTPAAKLNLIYPATETHIKKYDQQKYHLINETPELYQKYVEPYIQTMVGERIKWVKNILFEGYEAESVIYRYEDKNNGFILLPDMKWDGINIDSLYILAIVFREDIKSLRDINITHKEWLKDINIRIRNSISKHYKNAVWPDELRLFVHYQPSYYHFHIHAVNIAHDGLGNGIAVGKAILLEDIIEQLDFLGEKGFAQKTIPYIIGENHDLWKKGFKEEHYRNLTEQGFEFLDNK